MVSRRLLLYIFIGAMVLAMCYSAASRRKANRKETLNEMDPSAGMNDPTNYQSYRFRAKKKIKQVHTLTILYEALCPDSEIFMTQIGPVYEELKDYIQLEFVPFGLTKLKCGFKINGTCMDPVFRCKHGTMGCHANRMHDCALHHSVSLEQRLNFVLCTMGPHKESVDKCLYQLRYNLYDVDMCMNFGEGTNLQLKSYEKTFLYKPTTLPLILIDGEYIEEDQEKALKDLRFFICTLLTNKYGVFNKSTAPSMCRTKNVFPNLPN